MADGEVLASSELQTIIGLGSTRQQQFHLCVIDCMVPRATGILRRKRKEEVLEDSGQLSKFDLVHRRGW
jgi:hypothetical protein